MASTHKHIRSSTASKRPTTAIADGQLAINTNAASAGLFFKDSTGATIIKVGPVHVGTTAPNATPAAGGSSGNSTGEVWLDTSLTPNGVKIWNGSSWTNATPIGSTTVQGLLELATNAETQTGSDSTRAVTPAGLQSKVSDSTSTTSSTTIASSTAVKAAYDLANAALPKSGGTVTGALNISETGSLVFEGATADEFETTLGVVDPTADRTINLPDVNGTVITTGDSGTVTSTMIADGTIVDADISASAEIAVSKLADGAARQVLQTDAAGTGVEWTDSIALPGSASATSFSPTGSSVPTNGIYLPTTNTVAISTNSLQRLAIDSSGNVGIGKTSSGNKVEIEGQGDTKVVIDSRTNAANGSGAVLELWSKNSSGTNNFGFIKYDGDSDFEIGSGGNGAGTVPLVFKTNSIERARIDSSGRLLVGASSARTNVFTFAPALQVEGITADTSRILAVRNANSQGAEPSLILAKSRGTSNSTNTIVQDDDRIGGLEFAGADGANFISACSIRAEVDGTPGTDDMPGRLVFSTTADGASSPTERMRITSDGKVGVGTTSPSQLLHIEGDTPGFTLRDTSAYAANTGPGIYFQGKDSNENNKNFSTIRGISQSADNGQIAFDTRNGGSMFERVRLDSSGRLLVGTSSSQGSYNLQCYGTGVWGQGAYVNGSDANIKQNIQDLEPALDVIKAMRPVTFQYKQEYSSDQTIQPGFIAQELQVAMAGKAYVDGVVQQGTTHLNVAYSSIIAVLVKAVQELEAKVAALETP